MRKDKYGKIVFTASDDVCGKCEYKGSPLPSKACSHCDDNLHYNEYYKPKKAVISKVKFKSDNKLSLNTRIYLKESQGWTLVIRYWWFGKYVAIMKKSN